MEREIDLKEISDGKLYDSNDMVKADCQDCKGCSACCRGMGNSILLDPYDMYCLNQGMGLTFETMLAARQIAINLVDGVALPNLSMAGEAECCSFLDGAGRCSIHPFRPGFCRLFPLGRVYENGSFRYFLQIHECRNENRTKVKIRKWIDTPDIRNYEKFVSDWHYFLKDAEAAVKKTIGTDAKKANEVCLYVLNQFYVKKFEADGDFYQAFYERLEEGHRFLAQFS